MYLRELSLMVKHVTFNHYHMSSNLIALKVFVNIIKNINNRYAEIGRRVPLRTEWFYNCASSSLVTYNVIKLYTYMIQFPISLILLI